MGIIHAQRLRERKRIDVDETQEPALSKKEKAERVSDYTKLRTIWKRVEENNAYYGFAMCTVLFRNHPQYEKFFQNEFIPEFVQEAKIKKKFTLVCNTLCTLFVDYYGKPSKRDYLTGFIAMVHKDMGLTIDDIHNFFSSLLEALVEELPDIMTKEYIAAQKKYFDQLSVQVMAFMDQHNRQLERQSRPSVVATKKCLRFKADPQMKLVYGYPIKYWLNKRHYWEYRRAVWESLEADLTDTKWMDQDRLTRRRRRRSRRRPPSISITQHSSDTVGQSTHTRSRLRYWHEKRTTSRMRQMRADFEKKLLSDDQSSTPELSGTPQDQGSQSPIGAVDADFVSKLLLNRSRERRATLNREKKSEEESEKKSGEEGEKKSQEASGKKLGEAGLKKDSGKEVETARRGDTGKGTGVGGEREEMGTPRRKVKAAKERVADKPQTVDASDKKETGRQVKNVEDKPRTTWRNPGKPQTGTEWQMNEVARARRRKRTTYPEYAQPYDWSLLDDDSRRVRRRRSHRGSNVS